MPSHLGVSSQYRTRNEVIAMRTELAFTPLPSAPSSSLLEAPGLTLTRYIPKIGVVLSIFGIYLVRLRA